MEGVSSFFNEAESMLKGHEKEGYQSTNTSAAYFGPSQTNGNYSLSCYQNYQL